MQYVNTFATWLGMISFSNTFRRICTTVQDLSLLPMRIMAHPEFSKFMRNEKRKEKSGKGG